MKKTLLMTTALVAVLGAGNAYAESLPEDATNLTIGNSKRKINPQLSCVKS